MTNKVISPVPEGAEALILSDFDDRSIIYVANNDQEMARIKDCLEFFAPKKKILEFPAWDTMPYDRCSPDSAITSQRISTLSNLAKGNVSRETFIILTSLNAISQKLPPVKVFKDISLILELGENINRNEVIQFLAKNSYDRVSKVMEPGEFAVRGDIIDIFPSGKEAAVRLDFFGETIEQIKSFDPISQISQEKLAKLEILPACEIILDEERVEIFRKNYRTCFGLAKNDNGLYEAISSSSRFPGFENWLPLFYDDLSTLFDYVSRETLLILGKGIEQSFEIRQELTADYYQSRKEDCSDYNPVSIESFYLDSLNPEKFECVEFSDFNSEKSIDLGFRKTIAMGKELEKIATISKRKAIACYTNGSKLHIQKLLEANKFKVQEVENRKELSNVSRETIAIFNAQINSGFESKDLVIITEQDIFGDRFARTVKKKKRADNFFDEAASLELDEIVVHQEHGIGKFAGLEILQVGKTEHDMVKLLFAGDDRLFVPVENIDLISKYGANNEETRLDRLGGTGWQERTAKLKEKIKFVAEELLKIAAERSLRKSDITHLDEELYSQFREDFPYVETEDQQNSIESIFEDLKAGKPMDRLVCGDVGFGKTEVAMRAAFAVAASGKQVALICPTTLLARQHFNNFKKRFENIPFEIKQISRMVPNNVSRETLQKMQSGQVDIVIGTHALLADGVKFKNLGLVVIDEEQHFGVRQKEKLKTLKAEAHILSLSATPIPRSLQLAISGIRELSLIATPPVDRLPVCSFVSVFDEITIREAITRERNRGGQVFYVAPRVADLEELHKILTKLTPEARIAQAHGQMKPQQLDDVMNQFYDGKFDVLLSTAIVESGLDVQNANTLIIHRADMFGLSQLYQLRGRVGRGKQRGYAYFTLQKNKTFTKNAYKRLEVIRSLEGLGAGFSIASHDMDIRGFGNLLGEEQSGHVREVGVELYQKMLSEAVLMAKAEGEVASNNFAVNINLGLSVLIPESYITDLDVRMGLYKRAASLASNDEVDSFLVEIVDRFGRPPQEVLYLLEVIKLKALCRKIGIEKIDCGPKATVMQFIESPLISTDKLLEYVTIHADRVKIKPGNKLVFNNEHDSQDKSTQQIFYDLTDMAELAANAQEQAA